MLNNDFAKKQPLPHIACSRLKFSSLYNKSARIYIMLPVPVQRMSQKTVEKFKLYFLHKEIIKTFSCPPQILAQLKRLNKIFILSPSGKRIGFNGQNLQDLIAYLILKRDKGFFIDIGANDGITCNNTYFFEELGWNGVCVEPQPDVFSILKENRKCDLLNSAIAESSEEEIEFVVASKALNVQDDNMWSGVPSMMTEKHLKEIEKFSNTIIKVKAMSFDDIMKSYPQTNHIDFLSIDVEGGELNILRSIDFNKYTFSVLSIENNESGTVLIDFMKSVGYCVFMDVGLDIIFVPDSEGNI